MSFNEGAKIHNPLPAPPAISRSSVPPRILQIPTSKISPTRSSSIGPKPTKPISDKVGRWTEEEHMTFLAGLEKHGKQWKTIATMIGTRTVVQVRTHAQKYFQKQERKNKSSISSVEPRVLGGGTTACKRKSLPSTMPSHQQRSKKILRTDLYTDKAALHCKPRISISLTNIPKYTSSRDMPTPTGDMIYDMPMFSASSSSENLSTVSPVGVADMDICMFGADSFYFDNYQEHVVEDPLEWLKLDGPDAPVFPDFQESFDIPLQPSQRDAIVDSLPWMGDPKVTVQSLFLEEQRVL